MDVQPERFLIRGLSGEKKLAGVIPVGGAKNASLKLFAAALLVPGEVIFENVPDIEDIRQMADLIVALGGKAERLGPNKYSIDGRGVRDGSIDATIAKKFRASVVLLGPLLARFGSVRLPHPGGDVISKSRPIDFFIHAFQKMGATVHDQIDQYFFDAKKGLSGGSIFFHFQSVTATEAVLMAATVADGITTIKNAALEPEILDLAQFLTACGARIDGAGTSTISVEGVPSLHQPAHPYCVMPDRLEAGSFLILGALSASELKITNCIPAHLESLFELLERSGVHFSHSQNEIVVSNTPNKRKAFQAVSVRTHEYPGFPTDLQAPMTVFLTQTEGESDVQETIFDGRLAYTEDLKRMGANIETVNPHKVVVHGPTKLIGRTLESPDIRAGLAFLFAGIVAEGESILNNVHHVDRGYERIEKRLRAIGVEIERVR